MVDTDKTKTEDSRNLVSERGIIKGKITRIANYISSTTVSDDLDVMEIKVRSTDLTQLMEKFDEIQTLIEVQETDPQKLSTHEQERLTVENKYYSTKAIISRILYPSSVHHSTMQESEHNNTIMVSEEKQKPKIRLPQLELPQYSGDIQEWPAFKNLFECAMDSSNVQPLQRLQYLKASLRGEAANLIGSLLITESNYIKAMECLEARYENKTIIVNFHMKNFMSFPTVNKTNLKSFLSVLQQSLDSLSALKLPVDQWDVLLVYIITQKLDNSLRASWELNRKETKIPTLKELLEFLRLRSTAFDLMNTDKNFEKSPQMYNKQQKFSHISTSNNISNSIKCVMCHAQHQLHQCPNFLELPVDKRIEYIKTNCLCYNCLQPYKINHKCSKRTCSVCHGKHHSLIHLTNPPRKVNIATATNYPQLQSTQIPTQNPTQNQICTQNHNQTYIPQNITSNIPVQTCMLPQNITSNIPTQTCVTSTKENISTNMHPTGQHDITKMTSTSYITPTGQFDTIKNQQMYTKNQQNILATPSTVCVSNADSNQTLLSTAVIKVQDTSGNWHSARVLLDSGSEVNIVTHRLANKLNSKFYYNSHIIQGIGESGKQTQLCINTNIASRLSDYSANLDFIVMNKITVPLPHQFINISTWNIPKQQSRLLADPNFYMPSEIDMLIGAELFYSLLLTNRISLGPKRPQLIETVFGWVITGNIVLDTSKSQPSHNPVSLHITSLTKPDDLLVRFWQQEEVKPKEIITPEHKYCEQLFLDTTVQEESGHFTVTMPIQNDKLGELGNSFNSAYRNLLILESKFRKNPQLHTQYKAFIDEFIDLGHAEYISNFEQQHQQQQCYLPHLGVLKPDSRTTKLRTVVNASSKTSTGVSLNDILYEGPNIYNDVLDILLRFRMYKYAFTCDIVKMFRTIFVSKEQRPLLRILWRDSEHEPLKCIQLKTVTYGTKCAPYLACRTLRHLAKIYEQDFPVAAEVVKSECYMDDFLCGGSTIENTQNTCRQLVQLLEKGHFKLHKWATNEPKVLEFVQSEQTQTNNTNQQSQTTNTYDLAPDQVTKTLGIRWESKNDLFSVAVPSPKDFKVTKRNVLSVIAQIYDPLGVLAPTTIIAKIFIQDVWKLKLGGWDDTLPSDMQSRWLDFYQHIIHLHNINIPRYYFTDIPTETMLVGFCDASQKAYGACLYIRGSYPNKQATCNLVMSKTKVAPIKTQSLPRLELCGALLLAKLVKRLLDAYNNKFKIDNTFLYTDSLIVLHWIKAPYRKLHTYVSHRLMEILELTNDNMWNYVHTKTNSADLLTRGVAPQNLKQHKTWWNGPEWLIQDPKYWPSSTPQVSDTDKQTEMVSCHLSSTPTNNQNTNSELYDYFQKFSSFDKLTRIMSYVFRFINNARNKNKQCSHLTNTELNFAENFIVKIVQNKHFSKEIQELQDIKSGSQNIKTNSFVFKSSSLKKLNPYLNENNLLRIGGRIQNSNIPYNHAHPIILPQKEHITSLIIKQYHLRLLHTGIQNTLCNIRLKFWPINGRNEVKKVIHRCVRCIRFSARACEQQMGNLPAPRVSLTRAFMHVGVDFSGAIYIRTAMTRNCKYIKGYICLFICMSTKALHLELVTELTTKAFICALQRLISRRGLCQCLYSDNATNFKGANNELTELYKMFKNDDSYSQVLDFCNSNNIEWKFTVPLASHMGGLYEAGIKSVKSLLKRHLGNVRLTYELLYTVLIQVEGILNSRPLCSLKDVPENDIVCLTPAHFLIGSPITDIPEPNVLGILENRLSLYQRMSQIKQKMWSQFYNNYLCELQPRSKWLQIKSNLKIGDVVILKEEITPPACWPLGRVISVNKNSKDNLVRSVIVKTSKGEFMRPINKLVLLPCNA